MINEESFFRLPHKDRKVRTLNNLSTEQGKARRSSEEETIQICNSPHCEAILSQGRFLCSTCAYSAFEDFWSLLSRDERLSSHFIGREFRKEDWKADIFSAFNLANLRLKDARSIKNKQEIAQWETVLEIMQNVLQKFGVAGEIAKS